MGRKRTCSWCGPGDKSGPFNGFVSFCPSCEAELSTYANIGRYIDQQLESTGTLNIPEVKRIVYGNKEMQRKFDNFWKLKESPSKVKGE